MGGRSVKDVYRQIDQGGKQIEGGELREECIMFIDTLSADGRFFSMSTRKYSPPSVDRPRFVCHPGLFADKRLVPIFLPLKPYVKLFATTIICHCHNLKITDEQIYRGLPYIVCDLR